jgi:hypothetical protein
MPGIAVPPSHPLAEHPTYTIADLDGLRVLIHSRDQVPAQQNGVLAAAHGRRHPADLGLRTVRRHALPSAEAATADAVLVGSLTAHQQLNGWPWRPLDGLTQPMSTWVVRRAETRTGLDETISNIDGARWWLHVAGTEKLTAYLLGATPSAEPWPPCFASDIRIGWPGSRCWRRHCTSGRTLAPWRP